MWHKATGRVVYDPPRPGMKNKTKGWCVVPVPIEVTRYYRWWVEKERHVYLKRPSWDAHVSIVRGEALSEGAAKLWKKYHGARVDYEYAQNPHAGSSKLFWSVDVRSDFMDTIRSELGLTTGWYYHITIGRLYND